MLILLFCLFILLIALRVPVAIAMGLSALATLIIFGRFDLLVVIPQRMVTSLDSFPLMAVPLFILTGQLMNSGGITKRILDLAGAFVGHIRGGLSHVNVLASMLFAGISGSATADASGIGAVLIPSMVDNGYDEDWAVGITAASSAIGPIIPPSVLMIVYGFMTQLSIGRLFLAGIVPGVLIGLFLIIAGYVLAVRRKMSPKPRASMRTILTAIKKGWAPLLTPVIIIVGITGGIFTATEAGVIAVIYAIILGVVYKELTFKGFVKDLISAGKNTGTILFIVACATPFGFILSREQLPQLLTQGMMNLTMQPALILGMIIVLLFIVGLLVDGMVALLIFTPVFFPLANAIGLNPYHFATVMVVTIMVGGVTPPVGILLYIACSVSGIPVKRVSKLIWYFVAFMIAVVLIIAFVPKLVTFIPETFMPVR